MICNVTSIISFSLIRKLFRLKTEDVYSRKKHNVGPNIRSAMKHHNIAFGKALRKFRKIKNFSQEDLAFEAKRDRTYISVLELGQKSPTLDSLFLLCDALEISIIDLVLEVQKQLEEKNK